MEVQDMRRRGCRGLTERTSPQGPPGSFQGIHDKGGAGCATQWWIETLERKMDLDRDDLRRVRNDLASEMGSTGFLRMRERALVRRIESSTERLHQLQAEVSATREKIAGVTP